MTDKSPLTAETLRLLLQYDPSTGLFTWRNPRARNVKRGDIAGSLTDRGYIKISVLGKRYCAHRLAFLWMTGQEPQDQVDHINGIRSDNRWENLRPATASQNQRNRGIQRNNTSGYPGVTYDKARKQYAAQIKTGGRLRKIGRFSTARKAHEARESLAKVLYGEFYRPIEAA
ncbi:HNH endonuclease [Roseinatronobacter sp. NSM]|uniref:HNH endonuclease n=1 Tax=Roseinatronobacter sp. NSM TaxID=3457785 RepID=UPI0040369706